MDISKVVPLFGATSVIELITIPVAVEPEVERVLGVKVDTSIGSENTTV